MHSLMLFLKHIEFGSCCSFLKSFFLALALSLGLEFPHMFPTTLVLGSVFVAAFSL